MLSSTEAECAAMADEMKEVLKFLAVSPEYYMFTSGCEVRFGPR